jgi:ubiquinone/menaquinone biosynthesis C-methylase UbiE
VPGVWDYVHREEIATDFDEYFESHPLLELDQKVVDHYCTTPGWVVDLGCGTGRSLLPLARRGFHCVGVDLSLEMLRQVQAKNDGLEYPMRGIQSNLVELDGLRDAAFDCALCMFSSLGMIKGRENRRAVLRHTRRILKPDGLFILHVHNLWQHFSIRAGRRWLLRQFLRRALCRGGEIGDKTFYYREIPNMFVHAFTYNEIRADLHSAGFRIQERIPLAAGRDRPLEVPWFLGKLRANGWIFVCR